VSDVPERTREEIISYLGHDLDTLYALLDLARSSEEAVLYAPGLEVERGKRQLLELVPTLRRSICQDWGYCSKRNEPDLQDNITVIAAVSDVIATAVIGFPPVLIATILVKKGLTAFCRCEDV
jgi:hypothetical protein